MSLPRRKVRLVDIAEKAGVSRAAVGHILNNSGMNNVRVSEETRERVLKIARELDYRPNRAAQQLRGMPTRMLGVILDTVNIAVFSARLAAIEAEAHTRGYRLVIGQVHHDPTEIQAYLDDFSDRGMDAVLCLFDVMQDIRPLLQQVFRGNMRVVLHAAPLFRTQPCVRVDTATAIQLLVGHLAERQRKRIGLQLWSETDSLMAIRQEAWQAALRERGLPCEPDMIWTNPESRQKPSREAIDQCIQELVVGQKVDAVIASNDEWAVRLIQGLRRWGYEVPRDIAITGYDNLDIADVIEPSLTTIDQCHEQYAVAALDLAEGLLQGTLGPEETIRVIQPRLIVREST
ncbi:MAG: LacI family DNA-binding transcriptional regulator [Planctomycetaceae bacterium]|nr:LacI family DNA-binding transcriptional regulator [Planctomycetaceae bacterium]